MEKRGESPESQKAFYDSFWQAQLALSCDEKCRLRFILSEVKRLGNTLIASGRTTSVGLRIADVGCGRGWLTQLLSRFGEVTGFDRSTIEAKKRYPSLRFVECDILRLPSDTFDVAVCSEVIEHVRTEEQPKLVESLFSILRQGGTLIMTTPNKPKASRLTSELSLEHDLQPIEDWLGVRELKELVSRRFEIRRIGTIMFFPIAVRKTRPVSRVYRALYEQLGGYHIVDPLLRRTTQGLYVGLVARKKGT
jgi:SAM-dependent methyltransferase